MWPNPKETEEVLNGKLHFLRSANIYNLMATTICFSYITWDTSFQRADY